MPRLFKWLAILPLIAGAAYAQISAPPSLIFVVADPAGACSNAQAIQWNYLSGNLFGCKNSVWTNIGASGATSPTNQTIRNIQVTFDGGGVALSGSATRCTHVNYAGTIQSATLVSDVSGNATVDVKTVAYTSYTGPASASSITAAAIPALASAVKFQDTTLTGWSTTVTANSDFCFALSSPATVTWVQATLKVAAN